MVSSSSVVVVLADWFRLLGQLRAKCPIAPQLKQALLVCPSMFVALLQKPPLPPPLPPLPQRYPARDRPMSMGTGWLFMEHGAFEELNCSEFTSLFLQEGFPWLLR